MNADAAGPRAAPAPPAGPPPPEERKRRVAQTFDQMAPGYDELRFVSRTAERLVALAAPQPGERVLDVATGTGWVALGVARSVGPGGQVLGIDIAPAPLEIARRKAATAGLTNVDFRTGDAEHLDLPDGAEDAVLCASSIFFMPDPPGALREWRRVTRPGGRVLFSSFQVGLFGDLIDRFDRHLARFGVEPGPQPPFLDAAACRALLDEAGYTDARIVAEDLGYTHARPQDWWREVRSGLHRQALQRLTPEQRTAAETDYLEELAAVAGPEGIRVAVPVVFAVATVP